MPRKERPLDSGDTAVLTFARELRSLRERAGRPTYRQLSSMTHYSDAARLRSQADEPHTEPDTNAPYTGLAAFQREDAERFFGRDRLVDQLERLVGEQRVVVVVGASGAVKSSLLRSGLMPRLGDRAVLFTPGQKPLGEYAKIPRTPTRSWSSTSSRRSSRSARTATPDGWRVKKAWLELVNGYLAA